MIEAKLLEFLMEHKKQVVVIAPESVAFETPYFEEIAEMVLFDRLLHAIDRGVKYVVSGGIDPFSVMAAKTVLTFHEVENLSNLIFFMTEREYIMFGAPLAAKLYHLTARPFRLDQILYFTDTWLPNHQVIYDTLLSKIGAELICCCPAQEEASRYLIKAARKSGMTVTNLYEEIEAKKKKDF